MPWHKALGPAVFGHAGARRALLLLSGAARAEVREKKTGLPSASVSPLPHPESAFTTSKLHPHFLHLHSSVTRYCRRVVSVLLRFLQLSL